MEKILKETLKFNGIAFIHFFSTIHPCTVAFKKILNANFYQQKNSATALSAVAYVLFSENASQAELGTCGYYNCFFQRKMLHLHIISDE